MSAQSTNAKSIFLNAAERPAGIERDAYLAAACGSDSALRREVGELLAHHDRAGSFLETPTLAPTIDAPPAAATGTMFGPYKLVEPIGEGGMGQVWLAQQTEPVKRLVALKVVKAGMDTAQVLARFDAERQALAVMDHPNIAKVFDAGTAPSGRPFFVMELVKGMTITRYCDDHRLTPVDRLSLFVQVCQAVQHAHQKGIIHRDLKPSNVLVAPFDGRPVVKVIDFGIAKAAGVPLTEKTLVTGFGALVGTPEYMSPEQAELNNRDIDTRSDVYSLGVLLYELLTGTTPLTKKRAHEAALLEVLRVIREEEPPRPSTRLSDSKDSLPAISAQRQTEPARLTKLVRGELDWIVMKALEKDRNRRYESANALAVDVQRYLNDEPVAAGHLSAAYRVRKFVRRNRGRVAVAGVGLAVLVLGVAGLVGALVAVDAERRRKDDALDRLTRQQGETTKALAAQSRTLEHAGLLLEAMSNDFVDAVLFRQPEFGEAEKAFFRRLAELVDGLAREHPDTRSAWIIESDQYWFLGRVREALGELKEAEAAFLASRAARQRLLADTPEDFRSRRGVAMIQGELGALYLQSGRLPEAEAALREAISLATSLVADFPKLSDAYWYLVSAQYHLGLVLRETGRPTEAEAAYRAALTQVPRDHVPSYRFPRMVAQIHDELGILLDLSGRTPEAEDAFRASLAVHQKRVAEVPRDSAARAYMADSHVKLAILFARTGRLPDAEKGFREGEKIYRQLVGEFPLVTQYRVGLAWSLGKLGSLLAQANPTEAEQMLREALAIRRRLAEEVTDGPGYRRALALAHRELSVVLRQTGRLPDAEAELRVAVEVQKKLLADGAGIADVRRELAGVYSMLGVVLEDQNRMDKAEAAYREAVAAYATLADQIAAVPEYAIAAGGQYCNLGNALRRTRRPAESLEWYDRAVATLEPVVNKEPRFGGARQFLKNTLSGRSAARTEVNRYPDALADIDRVVELTEPGGLRVPLQIRRAFILVRAGDPAGAGQTVEEVQAAGQWPGWVQYHSARVLALVAATVREDAALWERHAARAVELLRHARVQDYFRPAGRVEQMKNEEDLAALHDRDDFRKFLAEVGLDSPLKEPPKR